MSLGRRGFLRSLLAAPLAARAATEAEVAKHMAMTLPLGVGSTGGVPASGPPSQGSELSPGARASKLFDFMHHHGLPAWEEERIRRDNHSVHALDADLAALRSFSLSVKVATQRERNVQKTIERIKLYGAYSALQDKFRKRHGFWLWY